jgi:tight adherence protein C
LGGRIEGRRADASTVRMFLIRAGYQHPNAVAFYWGVRVVLAGGLGAGAMLLLPVLGIALSKTMAVGIWLGAMGWIGPAFVVRRRMLARQKDIQLALPDMLDLLVVCVEAGLGLNQALVRVAEEIDHVSHVLSEQITLVNLEIRAGKPRDQALWNLGDRTGVPDVQSLCGILVQTDRFGTSVAQALRVHAETLRTKRRQRAEEAAAKTTIKLIFPLALFIFPAMFVVILAPALIALYRTFGTGAN